MTVLALCSITASAYSSDLLSIRFVNNEIGYISGENGYLAKTSDGGSTWETIKTESSYDIWDICPLGENSLITACSNGKILKTIDGGISWESKIAGINDNFKNIFLTYDNRLIVCGENSTLFISDDHGETWERVIVQVSTDLRKIFFLDGIYGYIVGSNGTLLATTDGGVTWSLKLYSNHRTNFTSISMVDDKTGTITGDGGLIINTYNGWLNWKKYDAPSGNQNINEVRYLNSTDAVAAGLNFILRTTNNGRDWSYSQLPINIYAATFNSIFFPSIARGFIVGSNGVMLTTSDQGNSWNYVDISNNVTNKIIYDAKQNISDINMSQNYPNPFNPSTVISYFLPHDSYVNLRVYDITGKEISSLVNEYKPAGNYNAHFNATELPSGVYFYTITSQNKGQTTSKTMKMLLIK